MSSSLLYVKYIFFSYINFITSHLGGLESHAHLYLYYCRTAVAEEWSLMKAAPALEIRLWQ